MLAAERVHPVIDNHQLDLVATDKSIGKKSFIIKPNLSMHAICRDVRL